MFADWYSKTWFTILETWFDSRSLICNESWFTTHKISLFRILWIMIQFKNAHLEWIMINKIWWQASSTHCYIHFVVSIMIQISPQELIHYLSPTNVIHPFTKPIGSSSSSSSREGLLRQRVENLLETLDKVTKNNSERQKHSDDLIDDLKRANRWDEIWKVVWITPCNTNYYFRQICRWG